MMSPQDKAALDAHITSEPEQAYDYSQAPILLAWSILDDGVCPMPQSMIERTTNALKGDDPEGALRELSLYYDPEEGDASAEQIEACQLFGSGWEHGVENQTYEFDEFDEEGWEVRCFSYSLGFVAGRMAHVNEDDTPYGPAND